jgi:hypothetical protein
LPSPSAKAWPIGLVVFAVISVLAILVVVGKRYFHLFVLVLIVLNGCDTRVADKAISNAKPGGLPVEVVSAQPLEVMFKKNELNAPKIVKVEFRNVTSGPVEFDKHVGTTCGCTEAHWTKTKIESGQTAILQVTIDPSLGEPEKWVSVTGRVVYPTVDEIKVPIRVGTELEWAIVSDNVQFRGYAGQRAESKIRVWVSKYEEAEKVSVFGIEGIEVTGKPVSTLSSTEFDLPLAITLPVDESTQFLGEIAISHPSLNPSLFRRTAHATIKSPGDFGAPVISIDKEPRSVRFIWVPGWKLMSVAAEGPITCTHTQDDVQRSANIEIRRGSADSNSETGKVKCEMVSETGKPTSCLLRVILNDPAE